MKEMYTSFCWSLHFLMKHNPNINFLVSITCRKPNYLSSKSISHFCMMSYVDELLAFIGLFIEIGTKADFWQFFGILPFCTFHWTAVNIGMFLSFTNLSIYVYFVRLSGFPFLLFLITLANSDVSISGVSSGWSLYLRYKQLFDCSECLWTWFDSKISLLL